MLTPKQEGFCKSYIETGNASEAYRLNYDASKMSPASINRKAKELIDNGKIAARLNDLQSSLQKRHEITIDYVLSTIRETVERCRQAEPVLDRKGNQIYVETRDGDMVPAFTFDSQAVLKGAELLGKHLKLFTDKVDISNPDGTLKPAAPVYNIVKK